MMLEDVSKMIFKMWKLINFLIMKKIKVQVNFWIVLMSQKIALFCLDLIVQ